MGNYADFLDLAVSRYSVRNFSDEPIGREKLAMILHAGQAAPTAHNNQPQRILVLESPEAIAQIRSITKYAFNAPTVLLICADLTEAWIGRDGHNAGLVDAAIVTTHMMLEAWDLGIGSCWVRGFDKNDLIEAFHLPEGIEPAALLPLGYPAEGSFPAKGWHDSRKPLEDTVEFL